MGHMTLVAEEIVKLFTHYPSEIYEVVEPFIPQPAWDDYVTTTLRETRDRDLAPLGGGVAIISHDAASTASGLSDEDDEFPNTTRVLKVMREGIAGGGATTDEEAFGGRPKVSLNMIGENGSPDQVSFSHDICASMKLVLNFQL
jgi:hypothetical protein